MTDAQLKAPELTERHEELVRMCQRVVNITRPHVVGERRDPATELMRSLSGQARWQHMTMEDRRKEMGDLSDCDRLVGEVARTLASIPTSSRSVIMASFIEQLGGAGPHDVRTQHAMAHLLLEDLRIT